jgi:hypothetical protein
MKALLVALFCLVPIPCIVLAAPPLNISDPGTPGDGHYELNVGLSGGKTLSGTRLAFPALDLNYGWGERLQIKYEFAWVFSNQEGEEAKNGAGNTGLGIKYRFLDEGRFGIDLSVYPQVQFNTVKSSVDKGLADKGTSWILPVEVQKTFGPIYLVGELGFIYNLENRNQWFYGLAFGYPTSKQFEWLGELFGFTASNWDWTTHDLVLNVGFRWNLKKWLKWNTSVGRSLHSENGNEKVFLFYTGLQFLI